VHLWIAALVFGSTIFSSFLSDQSHGIGEKVVSFEKTDRIN